MRASERIKGDHAVSTRVHCIHCRRRSRVHARRPSGVRQTGGRQAPRTTNAGGVDGLAALTLAEASARLRAGTVSSTDLVNACLARIDVYNPKVNAFITVTRDQALAQAKALDAEQRAGRVRGPLHGIPIALKDNIDTAGVRTTAASAVFDDRVPSEDAEVARRLAAAGAVVIGKANLHEFAFGGTSATSYYGPVRNPWALERNPGGSSGGSAAAVATDLCYGALGTDTGGSIRTPASYCSIVGLKPTYGLVSIRGIIPLTLSLDHCGPMTRTVLDAAMLLNALAGYDRLDIASVEHAAEDYVAALKQPVNGLRIGIPRAPFFDLLDADVARVVDDALKVIAKLTKSMSDTMLPSTRDITLPGETYAYHEEMFGRASGRYMIPDAASAAERSERQGGRLRSGPVAPRDAAADDRRCVQERRSGGAADAAADAADGGCLDQAGRNRRAAQSGAREHRRSSTSTGSRRSRSRAASRRRGCRSA